MKSRNKISFITTVFNEEETIESFLQSIFIQTKNPDEILIVDGGSTDSTVRKIKNVKSKITVLIKKGNRSIGRNEAIKHATGAIIVCSDAGNILDKDWIKNITEPFHDPNIDVVAGYYKGVAKNIFQKCVIPYALVMPDKINPKTFLPATRSIAFKKKIWEKVMGFDEQLSHNEDYAFAKALQKAKANIIFKRDAVVYWQPRRTLKQAFMMMYRFAYGDAEARIIRPKVIFIFLRYLLGFLIVFLSIIFKSVVLFCIFFLFFILYLIWAVAKNFRYVKKWQAIYLLPMLQLLADWAVLKGTVFGLFKCKIRYN